MFFSSSFSHSLSFSLFLFVFFSFSLIFSLSLFSHTLKKYIYIYNLLFLFSLSLSLPPALSSPSAFHCSIFFLSLSLYISLTPPPFFLYISFFPFSFPKCIPSPHLFSVVLFVSFSTLVWTMAATRRADTWDWLLGTMKFLNSSHTEFCLCHGHVVFSTRPEGTLTTDNKT